MDELRQVLDRIDVVVRRRRDEPDAGGRVADSGDDLVDLVAGELTAFARFRALGHLDLQLVGVDQVLVGDAEPSGGHLLDGAATQIAVRDRGMKRTGSSPPSPVLLLPPMRFMAMARVSWASLLIEPNDMAPVLKR